MMRLSLHDAELAHCILTPWAMGIVQDCEVDAYEMNVEAEAL